ncbi:uncharacterized protein PFLUO_LOCUS7239 [Penicillium psychrofluorescens]|uniref:uncharacterized protein n=1 Tax=Penicillium psychrofluorescens TaxID=3158075 RepID=UPI003CCD5E85
MRGASTGRDSSPSAPPTQAPMNSTPGQSDPNSPESPPGPSRAAAEEAEIQPTEQSNQASSSIASASSPPEAAESADAPKKHHLLIPMPSRRSSKKADKSSVSEQTEETGHKEPTRRPSKVSILKAGRDRSRASSRRSRRTQQDVANVEESKETPAPAMNGPARPQKKAPNKLFAFLSCCSSQDVDADDATLPAKKTTKRQPASNRLPTPDKAEVHNGDSSTAESRDPAYFGDEKASLTVSADQAQPQAEEEPSSAATDVQATAVGLSPPEAGASPVSKEQSEDHAANGTIAESKMEGIQRSNEPPSPVPEEPAAEAPAPKTSGDGLDESSHEEAVPSATVLPPPPPLAPPAPQARSGTDEDQQWLLGPPPPHLQNRKCLVLDLDETLVHSSFKVLERADFTIPVEIEGQYHNIYVIKRPGVDQFMKRMGELYEVVVFTASVSKYGDPLLDQLDIHNVVHHRLFRESCYNHQGNYVKDLSQVGRDLRETIIIDNSPTSYIFHPQHAIPISSWFSDAHDNELLDLIPVLEDLAGAQVQDVSMVLDITL